MNKLLKTIFILALFFLSVVSSLEWPLNKAGTCTLFNMTGDNCEIYWCNNIQGGNYSLQKEVCVFIINETIFQNLTSENLTSENLTSLNLTEIEKFIGFNITNQTIKQYVDEQIISLRNSILDNEENRTQALVQKYLPSVYSSSNSDNGVGGYIFMGVIAVCITAVVLVFGYQKFKPKTAKKHFDKRGQPIGEDPNNYYGEEDKEEDYQILKRVPDKPVQNKKELQEEIKEAIGEEF